MSGNCDFPIAGESHSLFLTGGRPCSFLVPINISPFYTPFVPGSNLILNAFVERAVQTYEHECLDQFIVISPKQLNVIGREFQTWYNYERPHSSVNHLPPGDQTMPTVRNRDSEKDVVCMTRLGGLLKSYSRRAA